MGLIVYSEFLLTRNTTCLLSFLATQLVLLEAQSVMCLFNFKPDLLDFRAETADVKAKP